MTDWHSFRAMLVEFGVSPSCMSDMSFGQMIGMNRALGKRQKRATNEAPMSGDEFEALKDRVREMGLPGVMV